MWDIGCLPFQAAALGISLLAMTEVMERFSCLMVVSCGLLQAVRDCVTFCTGLLSAESAGE